MAKHGRSLLAALLIAGSVVVGAGPVSATEVTAHASYGCHATLTVVPREIVWVGGRTGWAQGGTVSGAGTCEWGSGTRRITLAGDWSRSGGPRNAVTGECPPATFRLDIGLDGSGYTTSQEWLEMTPETGTVPSRQVFGIDPVWTPPVPFGTESLSYRVAAFYGVLETDPAACAAWPTYWPPPDEPFAELPAPPPFDVVADWNPPGMPRAPEPGGLVSICVTVQGVLPRTCV